MAKKERPQVVITEALCKGCGRCIEACPRHAISMGDQINQTSGLVPVVIDRSICNHCGLCVSACPEPYGLDTSAYELEDPKHLYGEQPARPQPDDIPARRIPLPPLQPLLLKGNHAAAIGALLAGCRHVFGYPITPSTEGAELLAKLLPQLHGTFMQACSEVATINHMYGTAGAGLPTMTFTSSPGFSLMLEGISYLIGSQLPAVIINVMRPGPGLGFIGPEQSDIKMLARGLGHGNTQAIVLAPTSPQEMLDLTMLAFELSFKYRNPVIVAADGFLGQITGRVSLPSAMIEPGLPGWAVWGDAAHQGNLNASIFMDFDELEKHNLRLCDKYELIRANEQRHLEYLADDAEILIVACNTPARIAKRAVAELRREGIKVGMFQPLTIWPFPIDALSARLPQLRQIVVVEASSGQLENELRLAAHLADAKTPPIAHVHRMGGILPTGREIAEATRRCAEVN